MRRQKIDVGWPKGNNGGRAAGNPLHAAAIREALLRDVDQVPPTAPDSYTFGKQAARMARLCLIAEEVEQKEAGAGAGTASGGVLDTGLVGGLGPEKMAELLSLYQQRASGHYPTVSWPICERLP